MHKNSVMKLQSWGWGQSHICLRCIEDKADTGDGDTVENICNDVKRLGLG